MSVDAVRQRFLILHGNNLKSDRGISFKYRFDLGDQLYPLYPIHPDRIPEYIEELLKPEVSLKCNSLYNRCRVLYAM